MASNNTAEFCDQIETNAMGESTVAYQTKTNKKANYIAATGISEATNFTINTANIGNQFNFPVDQTKANWGTFHCFRYSIFRYFSFDQTKKQKTPCKNWYVWCNSNNASLPFMQ